MLTIGHKDKSGKFHPHSHNQSSINSSDVNSNNIKVKKRDSIHGMKNPKICSRCDNYFDIDKARYSRYDQLPLCNKCHSKGLRPLGYPSHWVWNKMNDSEKQRSLEDVGIPMPNRQPYTTHDIHHFASKDFDDLPKEVRNRLRAKWGIEPEK